MVTGIPAIKNENVFDHINDLADIAKIDNFTQEQIDRSKQTKKKKSQTDTPTNKTSLFRQRRKFKNTTSHQFLELHIRKDNYQLNASEEDELRIPSSS